MKVKKIRENAHTFEEVSKKRLQNSQNQKKYTKNRKKSHILQHLSQFLNKKMHLNRALRSILSVQSRASFFLLLREGESKSKQGMNFWYLFDTQQVSKFRLTCQVYSTSRVIRKHYHHSGITGRTLSQHGLLVSLEKIHSFIRNVITYVALKRKVPKISSKRKRCVSYNTQCSQNSKFAFYFAYFDSKNNKIAANGVIRLTRQGLFHVVSKHLSNTISSIVFHLIPKHQSNI